MMDPTEPMTLGSPLPHSPNQSHVSPTFQSPNQFLPGYLMGDTPVRAPPSNRSMVSSPSLANSTMSPVFKASFRQPVIKETKHYSSSVQGKTNAPPVQSLNDENIDPSSFRLNQSQVRSSYCSPAVPNLDESGRIGFNSPSTNFNRSLNVTNPPSPTQLDPFYTQGELLSSNGQLDNSWVTVFGFPSSSASFVLQRFAQYGSIVTYRMAPNQGNWMHIQYDSPLQAKKALSRNAKILPGNVMVGVTPCIDVKLMTGGDNSIVGTPTLNTTTSSSCNDVKKSIRPLTSAYQAASTENKVLNNVGTPQKSEGLVSKAFDFMFG